MLVVMGGGSLILGPGHETVDPEASGIFSNNAAYYTSDSGYYTIRIVKEARYN